MFWKTSTGRKKEVMKSDQSEEDYIPREVIDVLESHACAERQNTSIIQMLREGSCSTCFIY